MSETALPPQTPLAKLPVIATAKASWRIALQAIGAMPVLAVATVAALALLTALDVDQNAKTPGAYAAMLPGSLLRLAILTPLQIAVCRFVLLHHVASGVHPGVGLRQAFVFFCYSVLVSLPLFLALWIPLGASGEDDPVDAAFLMRLLVVFLSIPVVVVWMVRTLILFPAIAAEAPRSTLLNALHDSKGRFWNMFLVAFWTLSPLIVIVIIEDAQRQFFPLGIFQTVFILKTLKDTLIDVLLAVPSAVMSCLVYLAVADRLGRPGELAHTDNG